MDVKLSDLVDVRIPASSKVVLLAQFTTKKRHKFNQKKKKREKRHNYLLDLFGF